MEVLLLGAVAMIAALILSAWLMTFAKWFPLPGVDDFLIDYKTSSPYRLCTYGAIQFRLFWRCNVCKY